MTKKGTAAMTRRVRPTVFHCAAVVIGTLLILSFAGTTSAWPPGGNGGGPGGGGGGSTPPEGTVYFRHEGTIWQMDGAGTPESRAPLATTVDYGNPSYARHGNERWFAYESADYGAPLFPNGQTFHQIRATSETGLDVQLLSETDVEIFAFDGVRWAANDASITFVGQRWNLDPDGLPVSVEVGLYELSINFSSGTPEAGALEFIVDLSGPLRAGPDGFLTGPAELAGHTWNPDRTQVAFGVRIHTETEDADEIWIADLPSGTFSLLNSANGVGWPDWSPDGSRIGYYSRAGAVIHNLDSGQSKVLKGTPSTAWELPYWSPTGGYFVIGRWDGFLVGEDAIYRFTANLGGKTALTAGLDDPLPMFNTLIPLGWRN
jgi:hypothetical protein